MKRTRLLRALVPLVFSCFGSGLGAQPIGTDFEAYQERWESLELAAPPAHLAPIHPMFAPGQIARASRIQAWAESFGFRVVDIGMGGKMVVLESPSPAQDIPTPKHRIQTIFLKAGSKSKGSNSPHVQFVPRHPENLPGEKAQVFLDPFDQEVPNRSPGNHTLMLWDYTGRFRGDLILHLPRKPYFESEAARRNEARCLELSKRLMARARGLDPERVLHYRVRETSNNPKYASFVQVLEPLDLPDRRGQGPARFRHVPLPRVAR